ncbi:MAG: zinc ABC transporter substrate-binding protein [Dehalococcoidia bacterium]|nr:zinc ABC transporter substrate-binding protein [Dehalococcoidia bacterium]
MFRHVLFIAIAAVLLMTVVSCNTAVPAQVGEKMGVAVTILPQQEFVERVGGDKVDITVMVPPGASPHTYEVTPAQMVQLSKARVYCKVGSPIEFELAWLDKLLAQNKDILVVDCSRGIDLIESEDPDEPGMDPHIWTSPRNVKTMVQNICEGMSQADPQNRQYYENNRDTYLKELDELDLGMVALFKDSVSRTFIVYHPAWGYFAKDYGLHQLGIEQEGKEPKAAYMSRLINEARLQNIKVIFISPEFDSRNAEAIAREIGGRVIIIDPLAGDYLENMREVAAAFKEALK